ncbi:MAG: hypothetical protein EON55_27795 [Alphaproteobacteria bacterium]|nr:MAG: hypothetical protein EON55_27795 [Alphaproteobacteria bacterium]
MLALPHRMAFGDYAWRDVASPDAPIWIRVDLARQLLSVFRGGDEIGTAVIIYGTDGRDTPSGVFPIRGKERLHRSLAYDADMPFTLWLTADGVAIHASSIERGRAKNTRKILKCLVKSSNSNKLSADWKAGRRLNRLYPSSRLSKSLPP